MKFPEKIVSLLFTRKRNNGRKKTHPDDAWCKSLFVGKFFWPQWSGHSPHHWLTSFCWIILLHFILKLYRGSVFVIHFHILIYFNPSLHWLCTFFFLLHTLSVSNFYNQPFLSSHPIIKYIKFREHNILFLPDFVFRTNLNLTK